MYFSVIPEFHILPVISKIYKLELQELLIFSSQTGMVSGKIKNIEKPKERRINAIKGGKTKIFQHQ